MTNTKPFGKFPADTGRQSRSEKRQDAQFRRQEDISVRESEKRFREAFEHAPIGMFLSDLAGGFLHVNDAFCRMTGYSREALLHGELTFRNLTHPDDIEHIVEQIDRLLSGENSSFSHENRAICSNGKPLWVRVSVTIRRNDAGQPNQLVCLADDISARKSAEQALRESEERFRQAADAAKLGAYTRNLETGEIFVSPEFKKIYGFGPDEQIPFENGIPANVIPEDRQMVLAEAAGRMTRIDGQFSTEHRIIRNNDRQIRWLLVRGRVEFQGTDNRIPVRSYGFAMDITDRKLAEEALRRSRDELEIRVRERTAELENRARQLVRLTTELTTAEERERRRLAETLHDHLQQLLVAARMQIEQLRVDNSNPDTRASLDIVYETLNEAIVSTRSLTQDLSPPVLYRGGLPAALQWLARDMEQKKRLKIHIHSEGEISNLPETLNVFLFTAARELLFNVVKHADTPEAFVRLTRLDSSVTMEVSDKGKGFSPSKAQFGDNGSGFGLFSMRERIEFLGGELTVESKPGRGSRFTVSVPIMDQTEWASPPKTDRRLPGPSGSAESAADKRAKIRVLLVDDHRVMREGLVSLLEGQDGMEVIGQADNGEHAIECVERLEPDVVTMDVSMPVMDGIEATRILKRKWPHIRVIGLSMFEESELAARMHEAGADAYLSKTGPSGQLVKAIRNEL